MRRLISTDMRRLDVSSTSMGSGSNSGTVWVGCRRRRCRASEDEEADSGGARVRRKLTLSSWASSAMTSGNGGTGMEIVFGG